ncbi:MAG TPA: hypothetical protein PLV58_09960 [Campylobacterales bacterium]|nr:hypothetical protein [Campylobacterales bacterium]
MSEVKRLGSYKTLYKLTSGFLRGEAYAALTANAALDTTRLTNNIIQAERDGLKIEHTEIPNDGKKPYTKYSLVDSPDNIKKAYELMTWYALKANIKTPKVN